MALCAPWRWHPAADRREVATALELIDEWLEGGEESGYLTYVLEVLNDDGNCVLGYVCFGPTPLTEWTYDLYWIAVDKSKHRGGVGKRLLKFVEEEVDRRGGRLLLIETSSQETYGGTIQFYERTGYELVGKVKDYYKADDDKLIFAKRLVAMAKAETTIQTVSSEAMNDQDRHEARAELADGVRASL